VDLFGYYGIIILRLLLLLAKLNSTGTVNFPFSLDLDLRVLICLEEFFELVQG